MRNSTQSRRNHSRKTFIKLMFNLNIFFLIKTNHNNNLTHEKISLLKLIVLLKDEEQDIIFRQLQCFPHYCKLSLLRL